MTENLVPFLTKLNKHDRQLIINAVYTSYGAKRYAWLHQGTLPFLGYLTARRAVFALARDEMSPAMKEGYTRVYCLLGGNRWLLAVAKSTTR